MLFIIRANDTITTFLSILGNYEKNFPPFNWAVIHASIPENNTLKFPEKLFIEIRIRFKIEKNYLIEF